MMRNLYHRARDSWANRSLHARVERVERFLSGIPPAPEYDTPVTVFNASTRLYRLSLNGAFSLLAAWALRARGVPVRHLVCHAGLAQCVLGTQRANYLLPPPCDRCIHLSGGLFPPNLSDALRLDHPIYRQAAHQLRAASLGEMEAFTWADLPLGRLCLPSLRWALRAHNLPDDPDTRALFRRYLASAASLTAAIETELEQNRPRCLVVFNGVMYPEAVARAVAERQGIPVITHEVGLRPQSAFFSHADATFRELDLPEGFALQPPMSHQLDAYLEKRFKGHFTMAGIQFWPQIESLPVHLTEQLNRFERMVPIFTNVIFDTSQIHANTLFETMFDWLDGMIPVIDAHPRTLFVLRAHPDEARPGKSSRESVSAWAAARRLADRPNVVFLGPNDPISSYELIRRAHIVLVYNSSIGLEASILGAAVLCAARARYTQLSTVFFPDSRAAYWAQLERILEEDQVAQPEGFRENARRFLYYELFHASLDLSSFLQPRRHEPGMVDFTAFDMQDLMRSPALEAICDGVLHCTSFVMPM